MNSVMFKLECNQATNKLNENIIFSIRKIKKKPIKFAYKLGLSDELTSSTLHSEKGKSPLKKLYSLENIISTNNQNLVNGSK